MFEASGSGAGAILAQECARRSQRPDWPPATGSTFVPARESPSVSRRSSWCFCWFWWRCSHRRHGSFCSRVWRPASRRPKRSPRPDSGSRSGRSLLPPPRHGVWRRPTAVGSFIYPSVCGPTGPPVFWAPPPPSPILPVCGSFSGSEAGRSASQVRSGLYLLFPWWSWQPRAPGRRRRGGFAPAPPWPYRWPRAPPHQVWSPPSFFSALRTSRPGAGHRVPRESRSLRPSFGRSDGACRPVNSSSRCERSDYGSHWRTCPPPSSRRRRA